MTLDIVDEQPAANFYDGLLDMDHTRRPASLDMLGGLGDIPEEDESSEE